MRHLKTTLAVLGAVTILVLAGNTIALAATGHAFILGKGNSANKQTTLSRTTNGPVLKINAKQATGVPLAVRGTGKVANLNADRIDGKDSSSFATGGYSTALDDAVVLTAAGETHQLMSIAVPAGHYVVMARLQGKTGVDGGGNDFRYNCVLRGGTTVVDSPVYRVGQLNDVENYLTYQGSFTGTGPITLTCYSGNDHTLTALSGSLVAIKVGT